MSSDFEAQRFKCHGLINAAADWLNAPTPMWSLALGSATFRAVAEYEHQLEKAAYFSPGPMMVRETGRRDPARSAGIGDGAAESGE
jgi:hypothetical protein